MKWKIVLVPFPFTNLTAAKLRPALVIYESERDVVVAFISSKIPTRLSEADILVTKEKQGFKETGLNNCLGIRDTGIIKDSIITRPIRVMFKHYIQYDE